MSDNQPWNDAIVVESISEEYNYIRSHKCPCGGNLQVISQALIMGDNGKPYDLLNCNCSSCGDEAGFYFDISSFFGR